MPINLQPAARRLLQHRLPIRISSARAAIRCLVGTNATSEVERWQRAARSYHQDGRQISAQAARCRHDGACASCKAKSRRRSAAGGSASRKPTKSPPSRWRGSGLVPDFLTKGLLTSWAVRLYCPPNVLRGRRPSPECHRSALALCVLHLEYLLLWTPSIVPNDVDRNVYLVVDDFGSNGRVFREADVARLPPPAACRSAASGTHHASSRLGIHGASRR